MSGGWWRGSAAAEAPRPCDLVIGGGETLEAGTLALVRKCDRRPDGGRARTASLVQTAPALSLTADRGAWLARYCRPDSLGRTRTSSCPPTAYRSTPSWLQTRHGQEASPGRRLLPGKVSGDPGRSWPSPASLPQTRRGPELDDGVGGSAPVSPGSG